MRKSLFVMLLAAAAMLPFALQAERSKECAKTQKYRKAKKVKRGKMHAYYMVKQEYPDEAAKLQKLKKENPEKFKKKVTELAEKIKAKRKAEHAAFQKLVSEYRKTQSPQVLEQIKNKLSEKFDKKMKMDQRRIQNMEQHIARQQQRLEKIKARYKKQSDNKEIMLQNKIKQVSGDPDLKW